MSEKDYLNDISEIKNMMNRSSRFISLSGLSGIFAGTYALIGAYIAYTFYAPNEGEYITLESWDFKALLIIIVAIGAFSIVTALFLTTRKAKRNNEKIWDKTTIRLIINFLIPLLTGGIYIAIKLHSRHFGITASLMLIFYGLALVNASKYTLGNIKNLGYAEIILGLICAALPGYGFWFWSIGFGILHIIYGALMHFKYDRK